MMMLSWVTLRLFFKLNAPVQTGMLSYYSCDNASGNLQDTAPVGNNLHADVIGNSSYAISGVIGNAVHTPDNNT